MKKYWKSTAIIAVIILSMGIFYVNSALSAPEYPTFIIEKQSGNDQELDGLAFESSYFDAVSYESSNLTITSDGSKYAGNSFIDRIMGQPAPMIQELQKEYRHFMRGKGHSPDYYFENDQVLAYAEENYKFRSMEAENFTLDVGLLDKDTNKANTFTVKVPESQGSNYIFVEDVQVVDNLMHVIVETMVSSNNDKYNYQNVKQIYTIDLNNETVSSLEEVISYEQQQDLHININLIKTNPKQANEQLLFSTAESRIMETGELDEVEGFNKELISYNLKTKEKNRIDLGEHLQENQVSYYDGTTVYLTKEDNQNLVITPYNLEDKQVEDSINVAFSNAIDDVEAPMINVREGKLYAINRLLNATSSFGVAVVDVNTRKILYTGEITTKEPKEDLDEFELYIQDISVR